MLNREPPETVQRSFVGWMDAQNALRFRGIRYVLLDPAVVQRKLNMKYPSIWVKHLPPENPPKIFWWYWGSANRSLTVAAL
jgi:hypothetical protein